MKGSNVRFIKLCFKLIFLYVAFGLFSSYCMDYSPFDLLSFHIFMIVISVCCLIWCYRIVNINCLSNKLSNNTYKKLKKSDFYQVDNYPIYTTQRSNGYAAVIEEVYQNLNPNQRKTFENKGFVIIVGSKEELKLFSKERFINGYFSRVGKYILLFTDCEISREKPYIIKSCTISSFRSTFYHEWGHFVDYANFFLSETLRFKNYYHREKSRFVTTIRFLYSGMPRFYFRRNPKSELYELKSSSEYFACKYSEYQRGVILSDYLMKLFESVEVS